MEAPFNEGKDEAFRKRASNSLSASEGEKLRTEPDPDPWETIGRSLNNKRKPQAIDNDKAGKRNKTSRIIVQGENRYRIPGDSEDETSLMELEVAQLGVDRRSRGGEVSNQSLPARQHKGNNTPTPDAGKPVISPGIEIQDVTAKRSNQEKKTGEEMVVRLAMNKRRADFSYEELRVSHEAVANKHISQTHFADPGAEHCYWWLLCRRVINGGNLPRMKRSHFVALHGDSTEEDHTIVNNKGTSKIANRPKRQRNIMAGMNRDRATLPNAEYLEQGEEVAMDSQHRNNRTTNWQDERPSNPGKTQGREQKTQVTHRTTQETVSQGPGQRGSRKLSEGKRIYGAKGEKGAHKRRKKIYLKGKRETRTNAGGPPMTAETTIGASPKSKQSFAGPWSVELNNEFNEEGQESDESYKIEIWEIAEERSPTQERSQPPLQKKVT